MEQIEIQNLHQAWQERDLCIALPGTIYLTAFNTSLVRSHWLKPCRP